jgi:hypothetical protein
LPLSSQNDGERVEHIFILLFPRLSWGILREKNNIGKQLNKNKKLLAEVVADTLMVGVEGSSEVVLEAMEFAPTLGLTGGC